MIMKVAIYRKDTGEIVAALKGSERDCLSSLKTLGLREHSYIEAEADPDLHFVNVVTDELQDRAPFPITIDGNTVRDVPLGTIITLPDRSKLVMDASGELELSVRYPETVALRLHHPHYLDATGEIEVVCA